MVAVVKFRIDERSLSAQQIESFSRHAGTARAAWNWALDLYTQFVDRQSEYVRVISLAQAGSYDKALELRKDKTWQKSAYKEARDYLSAIRPELPQQISMIDTGMRFRKMTVGGTDDRWLWWTQEGHGVQKTLVNYAFDDLGKAIKKFYSSPSPTKRPRKDGRPGGFPLFRSIRKGPPSFAVICGKETRLVVSGHRVRLPGTLGEVRVYNSTRRLSRMIANGGTTTNKTVRITQRGGNWYVVFTVDMSDRAKSGPTKRMTAAGVVGVDQGVVKRAALSDGTFIENPRYTNYSAKSISKCQKSMSRKRRNMKPGQAVSASYVRSKVSYAKKMHNVAQSRDGFIHRITKKLATEWSVVAVESLQVSNMTASAQGDLESPGKNVAQKSGLNRSILDASFYSLVQKLTYKTAWYGSELVKVPAPYTSQMCSQCGHVTKENRESQARFRCISCSFTTNADTNAALNIKKLALDAARV